MSKIRTDLAMESFQSAGQEHLPGVKINRWDQMGVDITEVLVQDEHAAAELGKPRGAYLTLECPALRRRDVEARLAMANLLGEELGRLVHASAASPVLVVGLGNRDVTPDSLGQFQRQPEREGQLDHSGEQRQQQRVCQSARKTDRRASKQLHIVFEPDVNRFFQSVPVL